MKTIVFLDETFVTMYQRDSFSGRKQCMYVMKRQRYLHNCVIIYSECFDFMIIISKFMLIMISNNWPCNFFFYNNSVWKLNFTFKYQ